MGATGLALMPFLSAGHTQMSGKYKDTVNAALKYLVNNAQVSNGTARFYDAGGPNHEHMYSHGMAASAVIEAYGMTNDNKLKRASQFAVNYIAYAQDPNSGGWLYTPRGGGDTSVVGWQIMALKSAAMSHLRVPKRVGTLAYRWLNFVQSDPHESGKGIGSRYGYRAARDRHVGVSKGNASGATTAIGLLSRNYLGCRQDDPGLQKGIKWIAAKGPSADDMYYNYYATMVMYQNDGPDGKFWKTWNVKMRNSLVGSQVSAGSDKGTWYFSGNHGDSGGRVYNTALAGLTLEVYYRYPLLYKDMK